MITLDGESYDVPIKELTRKADFLYKLAERDIAGNLHTELIGVYFNYKLAFGNILSVAQRTDYRALWKKLTEAQDEHEVIVYDEDGTYTFDAYFNGVTDSLVKIDPAEPPKWKDLVVEFIAREPAVTP